MELKELTRYLTTLFSDLDVIEKYAKNGLQVEGKHQIRSIGFSVDATTLTIKKAQELGCDCLITHHGLFWPQLPDLVGANKKRVKALFDTDISLFSYHLPLDKHPKIGNNIQLLKLLGCKPKIQFGHVSYIGTRLKSQRVEELITQLNKDLNTKCNVFVHNNNPIKTIAVCTGSGSSELQQLFGNYECDVFITGELRYEVIDTAREYGITLIEAGHYATETLGIKALMQKVAKDCKVSVEFIEYKINK